MNCNSNNNEKNNVKNFGYLNDGRISTVITLKNSQGTEISVSNFGATITSIKTADRDGVFKNIVIGYSNVTPYEKGTPYFGATVGRFANRIAKGKFTIDNTEYNLPINNGNHHLHGGDKGLDKILWDIEKIDPQQVILKTVSADGDMGYPGDLTVQVKFSLDNNNNLRIDYQANTNKKTPINLTNHSYFNLSGDFQNQINNHELILNATQYTPIDSEFIPIGELRYVRDTPFDFTKSTIIGKQIIHTPSGFDHNFVLDKEIEHEMYNDLYRAATLTDPISGRQLQIYTTEPGIQFYTGNFLNGSLTTENGQPINKHTALCLETQHFPNSPNEPLFPNTILDPGTIFRSSTIYSFKVTSKQF